MPRTCTVCWRPHGTMETSCNDGNPMQRWQPHACSRFRLSCRWLQDTSEPAGGGVRWRSPPAFEAREPVDIEKLQQEVKASNGSSTISAYDVRTATLTV